MSLGGGDHQLFAAPLHLIRAAVAAVPAVRYALGLVGIAATAAVVAALTSGYSAVTLVIVASVFIGMILLFVFSQLVSARSRSTRLAAQLLLWAVTVFFITFVALTATAATTGWPCHWAELLGLRTVCAGSVGR